MCDYKNMASLIVYVVYGLYVCRGEDTGINL